MVKNKNHIIILILLGFLFIFLFGKHHVIFASEQDEDMEKTITSILNKKNQTNEIEYKCEQMLKNMQEIKDKLKNMATTHQKAILKNLNEEDQKIVNGRQRGQIIE
ncbi:hypothetical protein J8J04_00415 ['Fragaria x ananassa' phyllody phytoplasma]|uniref:Sequence-variable mosaic (SVM) signal sequence domain-containing protein n=1 Tax='Fragaria x ananassa' phyllody phytoplasma TaxID=2358428 RepID=A0ABS5K4K7_9MOLU|nr:hypothetical protein ['Fragaria x ananassa' phyllody phytoplasma]MBS2126185.1 hypothetical protein ['Fragaria x ananassa' phyllody phytoplasma]